MDHTVIGILAADGLAVTFVQRGSPGWATTRARSAVGPSLVAGPTVWNSLPDKLRDPSLSIDSFRRQLKTFLFVD